jgi:glutathione S-transferase
MLKIYHMPGSRSTRIIWAAEELGLPYELIIKQRAELKLPDFLALNPLGNAPAIQDGEVTLHESSAIVQYLIDRYDSEHHLAPQPASPERGRYLQWLHLAEASLWPLIYACILAGGRFSGAQPDPEAMRAAATKLGVVLDYIDDELAQHPYITGAHFSGADIVLYWNLMIGQFTQAYAAGAFKHIDAYLACLQETKTLATAMEIPAGFINQPPGSVQTPRRAAS